MTSTLRVDGCVINDPEVVRGELKELCRQLQLKGRHCLVGTMVPTDHRMYVGRGRDRRRNADHGKSRGWALLNFRDHESAAKALAAFEKLDLAVMKVSFDKGKPAAAKASREERDSDTASIASSSVASAASTVRADAAA